MKKKLNLLWNLKFNFFSVAERPLTFFAYFLNAKKVGRRRLVISPRESGGLPLFPHAASVPAPALAPVRSHFTCGETARPITGPAFWVCRAKAGAAFRCAKPPCAVVRFAAMASPPRTSYFAVPVTAAAAPGPQRQNPGPCSRSVTFRLRRTGRVVAPTGSNVLTTPSADLRQMRPREIPAGSAGVLSSCSHMRLPFPPRPLLPLTARISSAAKPRVRSSAPPFGFAAQSGRGPIFAARKRDPALACLCSLSCL